MTISHNISALNTFRKLTSASDAQSISLEKLSSGLRINRAGDDAAGLAISEKMRAQIRGLNQSSRNIQDGISLVQTAEGGMNEIHSLLQRGRELSVQAANGTMTAEDRDYIQQEITQIADEVDRISSSTEFNTIKILNQDLASSAVGGNQDIAIISALKRSWLRAAEQRVKDAFGIEADGYNLDIRLVNASEIGSTSTIAAVSYSYGVDGKAQNVTLKINRETSSFNPPSLPNGGSAPMYADRVIAHEMTHAIMGRTMNYGPMNKWFKEGAAEFVHGADERLKNDIYAGDHDGDSVSGLDEIMSLLDKDNPGAWASNSASYSAGYIAVRYLHEHIKNAGNANGVKAVFAYLDANESAILSQALNAIDPVSFSAANGEKDLFQMIQNDYAADKANFLQVYGKISMDSVFSPETDTGAIGGLDADGSAVQTAESIVDDLDSLTDNPLVGFN